MEYAGGGDLLQKIKECKKQSVSLSEPTIWKWLRQLIQGLNTLHGKGILHRDLKCANIFLMKDEETVKLGDLNVSKVQKSRLAKTQTGTPYYASPEI